MKDFKHIAFKIFKSGAWLPLLFVVTAIFMFSNALNYNVVYASEQIALISCKACVVEADNISVINQNCKVFSDSDNSSLSFCDSDISLNSKSKLEYVYNISNISSKDCLVNISLNKLEMQNFKVEYFINDEVGNLNNLSFVVGYGAEAEVKVVVSIDNISQNAILDGSIDVTVSSIGG